MFIILRQHADLSFQRVQKQLLACMESLTMKLNSSYGEKRQKGSAQKQDCRILDGRK